MLQILSPDLIHIPFDLAQNIFESDIEVEDTRPPPPKRMRNTAATKRSSSENRKTRNSSYVYNKISGKGHHLVKIAVFDLSEENNQSVVLSAQYVCRDIIDEVMDMVENIIRIISKKVCENVAL